MGEWLFRLVIHGVSLQLAEKLAKSNGFTLRVVEHDGEALAVAADYDPKRLNIAVEGWTVLRCLEWG